MPFTLKGTLGEPYGFRTAPNRYLPLLTIPAKYLKLRSTGHSNPTLSASLKQQSALTPTIRDKANARKILEPIQKGGVKVVAADYALDSRAVTLLDESHS
jgi:hypothetical protein